MSLNTSPSIAAMDRFVLASSGLRAPQIARKVPGLPTLPDLKKLARDRQAAGHPVIDQSAGDISDVGEPLSEAFLAWIPEARDRLVQAGCSAVATTAGDAYGYPGHYQQQYPEVLDALARSWGLQDTPFRGLQTLSGRVVLDLTFVGLLARAAARGRSGRPALILDPLAWSGYGPLADDRGITLVHMPAVAGRGLAASAEGLQAALAFARDNDLDPIAALPILPSNPTGVGMERDELGRMITVAAEADLPVLIDGFYSPLAPEGHAQAVPLGWLERTLPPEVFGYVGLIVGETKVTSSQNKTGSVLWAAPTGNDAVAKAVVDVAATRMRTTNCYPRPQEAVVAYALHTFAGGIHAAMGPRYLALDRARQAMREACDELGLPLSIGSSFYGTVGLVDAEGIGLIRGERGRPLTQAGDVIEALIGRYGLVGAPGAMFSSAPEAGSLVRLTAAVTLADVQRVRGILSGMLAAVR